MQQDTSRSEYMAKITFLNIWIVIGILIIGGFALSLIGTLSDVLLFLCVGAMSAFVASPIVNRLERRGVPRGAGAFIGLVVVLVGLTLLFVLVIPMVTGQIVDLVKDAPAKIAGVGTWIAGLEKEYAIIEHLNDMVKLEDLFSMVQDMLNQVLTGLLAAIRDGIVPMVNNIASTLFTVFLGFVLAYWLANDYPTINEEICRVLPDNIADDYRLMLAVVSRSVGGYLRSTLINSTIQGFLAFLGFLLVGHPYAATMGLLSGLLNIIPVVGPSISAAIAVVIALFYSPIMAFWTLVMAVLSQNVTDNLIAPKINQSTMSVHPVLSLTALVVGSTFGGAIGMVVALPLVAVIKSLFIFYFENRTGEQIVSYDGALFRGTPFHDADGNPVPAYDALGDDAFAAHSQILDTDAMPDAEMEPKPQVDLDNPWAKLMVLENPFGSFENPFAAHDATHGSDVGSEDSEKPEKPEETDTTQSGH